VIEVEDVRLTLDHCVKCNICTTFCPVSNVTTLFPGPKYVGPQAERFRAGDVTADHSLDYCSGCGICTQVCPQGVKIAEINNKARAKMVAGKIPLRNKLIARPALLGQLTMPVAPLANRVLELRPVRWLMESVLGIHRDAPLPKFSWWSFQEWARRHSAPAQTKRTVVYFHGCSANYYEPHVGQAAVAVLEHNGCRVIIPPQGCCGLPLQSNGDYENARRYARDLVKRLLPYVEQGFDIVATSTSCGLMLKREYREILDLDEPDFRRISESTYDICEYLRELHDQGELDTAFQPLDIAVPYHAPCQQKAHGMGRPALDLLGLIPDLRVIEMDADCCGTAGTYGYKREKYEVAMAVGAKLFRDIRATSPELSICDSETCRWQIVHGTRLPSVHPVELMARAYGLTIGGR
jgi:glycerol-3-phosphate dehydrogenase subunit C